MELISSQDWAKYREVINNAFDTFADKVITLQQFTHENFNYGEGGAVYNPLSIPALMNYNVYRTWPVNDTTHSGTVDKENVQIILNYDLLNSLGLIFDGRFLFKPQQDYFIIDGEDWIDSGITNASQAPALPLFVDLILMRKPKPHG